jgi:hypothetical protein
MKKNRYTGRRGWAGKWDRHRWKVQKQTAVTPEVPKSESAPKPPKRLRSLDEFERPPELPSVASRYNRSRTLSFTWEEVRLMLLLGVFCGLAYTFFLATGQYP